MRLESKSCLITGAGSGIGRSTALLFAREGAAVAVNDINHESGEAAVEEIQRAGGTALFIPGDVTSRDDADAMANRVMQTYGKIDVLFNNAGVAAVGAIHEVDDELRDRTIDINIKGVMQMCKAVVPHMMHQRSGSIINMSSALAEIGLMRRAVYAATKGAVLSLTKCMQVDYAPYGIRVNALLPGTILTPFVEKYLKESYENVEEGLDTIRNRQLTGDLGRPEDVAYAALYLASDESKMVMGAPFYVDGGCTFGKMA